MNHFRRPVAYALVFASLLPYSRVAHALIEPLAFSSETQLPSAGWMSGDGAVPKGDSLAALMAQARQAQMSGDGDTCLKKAEAAFAKTKTLNMWIANAEIDCATHLTASPEAADRLSKILAIVDRNPNWLLTGAQAPILRAAVFKAYIATLEQDIKTNRARANKTVEKAQPLAIYGDEKTRARMWRLASDLAFANQKPDAARDFLLRSLRAAALPETRARLAAVEKAIGAAVDENNVVQKEDIEANKSEGDNDIVEETAPTPSPNKDIFDASAAELALQARITASVKAGDPLAVALDSIQLIKDFPGGNRAKWATDRVSESYWLVADKGDGTDTRYTLMKTQIVREMMKADADRIADWAKTMYARGQWEDSLTLSQKALDTVSGVRSIGLIEMAAKSALATDHFELERKYLDRLILQAAGQPQAREALLRSGLLHYRKTEYPQAVADFERLLADHQIATLEITTRYWLWRSLQKLKSEKADAAADALMKQSPFSYYGLRARYERAGNVLEFKRDPIKVETKIWLTDSEKRSWDRALLLIKAGWLEEAQAEVKDLPPTTIAEDKALRALLWAASGQYTNAAKLVNEAWDEKPALRRSPFVEAGFPKNFESAIKQEAVARSLSPELVEGLIKQESGYNVKAVSPSSAYGLMQMIPPTAREIAHDLHMPQLNLPDDMFQAARNITMGTYYLSRMVNRYHGHVPLALAAYNAGPARIDRWLKSRPSLAGLSASKTSAPDSELWIDELPLSEPSTYVKSILRNLLMYRLLEKPRDNGHVEVADPVWQQ